MNEGPSMEHRRRRAEELVKVANGRFHYMLALRTTLDAFGVAPHVRDGLLDAARNGRTDVFIALLDEHAPPPQS